MHTIFRQEFERKTDIEKYEMLQMIVYTLFLFMLRLAHFYLQSKTKTLTSIAAAKRKCDVYIDVYMSTYVFTHISVRARSLTRMYVCLHVFLSV